jgi:hypothetical protein
VYKLPAVHPIVAFELNFVGAPGGTANNRKQLIKNSNDIYCINEIAFVGSREGV